jgi:hypothetical protein
MTKSRTLSLVGTKGDKGDKGTQVNSATYIDANNTLAIGTSDGSFFYANGVKGAAGTDAILSYYTGNIGNGSSTSFTINHNLNKSDVSILVFENSTNAQVYPDISVTNNNTCVITFVSAPTSSQYRVRILGY